MSQQRSSSVKADDSTNVTGRGASRLNPWDHDEKKLFVGNLDAKITSEALNEHFGAFGNISHAEVMCDSSGNSRGFGFVVFETVESANQCLAEEQQTIQDSLCAVRRAKARSSSEDPSVTSRKLWVGNLPEDIVEDTLKEYFGKFGAVETVDIILGRNRTGNAQTPGKSLRKSRFAFVVYEKRRDACAAQGKHPWLGLYVEARPAIPRHMISPAAPSYAFMAPTPYLDRPCTRYQAFSPYVPHYNMGYMNNYTSYPAPIGGMRGRGRGGPRGSRGRSLM